MKDVVRVNCYSANCNCCSNVVFIKENDLGTNLYICKYKQNEHEVIKAKDCEQFRCTDYGHSYFCYNCNAGETVKKLSKRIK